MKETELGHETRHRRHAGDNQRAGGETQPKEGERARNTDADRIFVTLMVAHHEGGIHMAEAAASQASIGQVATMARQMAARDAIK